MIDVVAAERHDEDVDVQQRSRHTAFSSRSRSTNAFGGRAHRMRAVHGFAMTATGAVRQISVSTGRIYFRRPNAPTTLSGIPNP